MISNSVSIIIPSYNRCELLTRSLDSVFAQSTQPDEVIIVDDGSTDETESLIRNDYPQAQHLKIKHAGVSAARNAGIEASTSEWIALLDSDDAWQTDKLEKQLAAISASDYRLCHTDEIWYRNQVRVNPMHKHKKRGGWIFQYCLPLCCISPSSVLIHRSVFDEVGLFDTSLPACEDYDLWLRICARMPVLYIDEMLTIKYGGHADQLSRHYWGMDRFRIQALRKIIDSRVLNPDDERAARQTLCDKITIFIKGARKHNNPESEDYAKLLQQYLTD